MEERLTVKDKYGATLKIGKGDSYGVILRKAINKLFEYEEQEGKYGKTNSSNQNT